MRHKVKTLILAAALALGAFAPAFAMGIDMNPPVDPNYTAGKEAIDAKDWPKAVDLMTKVVAADAKNADAFNYLGFAQRNSGDYPAALIAYNKALALDPKHKGAHEYLGEAYLKLGDLPKAEAELAALDRLCTFGCAEYTELKNKVAAARAGKTS